MKQTSHGGAAKAEKSMAYKDMSAPQKVVFILKLTACILTFGFAFPNVMTD
jgi:hypothetical protein